MPKLADVIQFREDRLFHGAVSLNWLWTHPELSREATEAYIFHGPSYHGVDQQDIGTAHGLSVTAVIGPVHDHANRASL